METTRPLADFVTDMAYHSSTNASFAFDQVADIGRDLEFKGVPESLKDAEVKQVFSLGSDLLLVSRDFGEKICAL